jgi:hypothetical protein
LWRCDTDTFDVIARLDHVIDKCLNSGITDIFDFLGFLAKDWVTELADLE